MSYGKSSASSLYAGSLLLSLFLLKFCPYSTVTSGEEGGGRGAQAKTTDFAPAFLSAVCMLVFNILIIFMLVVIVVFCTELPLHG